MKSKVLSVNFLFWGCLFLSPLLAAAQGNAYRSARDSTLGIASVGHGPLVITSFESLWNQVIRNNPTERVYALNIQKAVTDHKAALGFIYPSLNGGFTGQANPQLAITPVPGELVGRPGTTYDVRFGKPYVYGAGFSGTENLFNWTQVFQAKVAGNNVLLNQAQAAAYEQSLKEETARYWYAALVAAGSIRVAMADLVLADSAVALAQRRLDQGLSDQTALNQAKINYNDVTGNLAQSHQLYDQGLGNLRILLGKLPGDSLVLGDSLDIGDIRLEPDEPGPGGMPDGARNAAPLNLGPDKNLDVYRTQLEGAQLERKQRLAAFYPSLTLDGYFGQQQFMDEFGMSFIPGAWTNYSYIGVNLNVPIFNGFTNRENLKSAEASVRINTLQYDNARLQSQVNDDLLIRQYANYLQVSRASKQNFLLYADNLELARRKFMEGLLAADAYLKVFEDYLGAENTYLNNLSNLFSTRATILGRN
jgi:outer membrane protein